MVLYVLAAVSGSTLIKYGSMAERLPVLFTVPVFNLAVSLVLLVGLLFYGISFVLYIVLLSRFDLSFISPLLIGFVYVLLMLTAAVIFKEHFTIMKTVGATLVLAGILLILLGDNGVTGQRHAKGEADVLQHISEE